MHEENFMIVQVWDEQVGAWADVDDAKNTAHANTIIANDRARYGNSANYSILQTTRVIVAAA